MAGFNDDFFEENKDKQRMIINIALGVLSLVVILLAVLIAVRNLKDKTNTIEQQTMVGTNDEYPDGNVDLSDMDTSNPDLTNSDDSMENVAIEDESDPQQAVINNTDEGAKTDITGILTSSDAVETKDTTIGIDVSRYQGTIDWKTVADSGIDFAMIRVGYRTTDTGEIKEDSNAGYNLQEATANNIKVGAYFFSTAVNEDEAREEALWTVDFISKYDITYPVAFNCEGYENSLSRQFGMDKAARSNIAKVFLNTIYDCGYTPMFYASKSELEFSNKWETDSLEKSYKIWLSWYPKVPYPDTENPTYSGEYSMWQYTNNATVAGIKRPVDVNVAYFGYETSAGAHDDNAPDKATADVEALMNFVEVDETVTAKDATNLRNIPSQGADSTIIYTLRNGETAHRSATSAEGWSRLEYNGQTCYAVSSYLTTDLEYKPMQETKPAQDDDGIKTEFTPCNDKVSPKIEVNLRTLPSVTNPDSQVVVKLEYGKVVERTGYNSDYGWSRVIYEGQTLYCISSYIYVVEDTVEP